MTYDKLCKKLEDHVASWSSQGKTALQTRDHELVQECIFILELISRNMGGKHITVAAAKLKDLKDRALNSFVGLCEQAQQVLASESSRQFEGLFADYRSFVLFVPCIMTSATAKKSCILTNQLIFETLDREISQLEGMVGSFSFAMIKSKVEHVRAFGDFIADRCTLFHEEVKCCEHIETRGLKKARCSNCATNQTSMQQMPQKKFHLRTNKGTEQFLPRLVALLGKTGEFYRILWQWKKHHLHPQ